MFPPILDVDLDRPPEQRWDGLADLRDAARHVLHHHVGDILDPEQHGPLLSHVANSLLPLEIRTELHSIAAVLEVPHSEILAANLYYDAIKHMFGCSAFAVDTPHGPLHARNLDWPTTDDALARNTLRIRYWRQAELRFEVVAWPGYNGCLSGMAPGRFAITLNTVASDDPAELLQPVAYLLREVLDSAPDYDTALRTLSDTQVASDSLLLLSGTRAGELAVIERSPKRSAVRHAQQGHIVVTNDYRSLKASTPMLPGDLGSTSCARYDRVLQLCSGGVRNHEEAFKALDSVKMSITVQQMVFAPSAGELWVQTVP